MRKLLRRLCAGLSLSLASVPAWASEADLKIPDLTVNLDFFGQTMSGTSILSYGIWVCILGMLFGLYEYFKIRRLPVHKKMSDVSDLIYETCKTYMIQQGKFLIVLQLIIGAAMVYYFYFLRHMEVQRVALVLLWSVLGILGSYGVAWFGIRINTYANSRTAFA